MTTSEHLCEVCGARPTVAVACSSLGAFSLAYCRECLSAGAEAYWACIATASCCGWPDGLADWAKDAIERSLAHLGKSREQFDADVAASLTAEAAGLEVTSDEPPLPTDLGCICDEEGCPG